MSEQTENRVSIADDAAPASQQTCENCGAPIDPLDKFCGSCGAPHQAASNRGPAGAAPPSKYFRCQNCGAEVATDPNHRSYTCPFCDSTYVVEFSPDQTGRQPPEFVIGFAVTPEAALEKFQEWIGQNHWFRPGDLKLAQIAEKQKGVYLPFWSFAMLAQSRWWAEIGEYWYRTETYTTTENGKTVTRTRQVRETEWWNLDGNHHCYYHGYLISGSRGLPQNDADRIKPFQLAALKRYAPDYLAGWLSEEYSIDRPQAEQQCREEFTRRENGNIQAFLPGDTFRSLHTDIHFSDVSSDLILLPVYLLSYRYQDKLYRFLVNGQTGKVAGDKPLSWRRIGIAIAVGVGVVTVIAALVAIFGR